MLPPYAILIGGCIDVVLAVAVKGCTGGVLAVGTSLVTVKESLSAEAAGKYIFDRPGAISKGAVGVAVVC